MRKNINLQQFLEILKTQTNEFENHWLGFNRENKKDYLEYSILEDWFKEFSNYFVDYKNNNYKGDKMSYKSHISLEEFVVEMHKKVEDFKVFWENKNKDDPDNHLMELWEDDWESNFVNHYDMVF